MLAIINAKIILEHSIIENGTVLVDGQRIADLGARDTVEIPEGAEIYDACGLFVGPGFVDIHNHGGGGYYFSKNPTEAAQYFLSHGETTVLPTLYTDLDKEQMIASIERIKAAMEEGAESIGGIYMECPYMNPKFGAMPEQNKWAGKIRPEVYEPIVEAAGEYAKVWVIAPEREGLIPFLKKVKATNPGAVISVGHSEATVEQVQALRHYGIGLQTHCMNATGRIPTIGGTRSCGPDEACMLDKEMYAEVICDSLGIHVHADMLRLILAVKGVDKVVLITDSFVSAEPNPPELSHITDLSYDAGGGLCGSKLTQDVTTRNVMKHAGVSITDAFLMSARNPARAIGIDREVGTLTVGKRANIVVVDGDINVQRVMLNGRFVK